MSIVDQSDVTISMSDGVEVAVRIFRPDSHGVFPTLFAASPYRYDNDDLPPSMVFFWHETGPIHWYLEQGYAYVHLDVRGSGKSGGEYGFLDARERQDLYEVIEWIALQPWSNGKIGGIGQSYYAVTQWGMASVRPPHLACIAPFDGNIDPYRGWAYQGGVASNFMSSWWNGSVRQANKFPANGSGPRDIPTDVPAAVMQHPLLDSFWEQRLIAPLLEEVQTPVYSIGVWAKRDIHLHGNIRGYHLVKGPKKLKLMSAANGAATLGLYASEEFHRDVLLPFYDHWLKGVDTEYVNRPDVEFTYNGTDITDGSSCWPPADMKYATLYLNDGPSGSVASVNDGGLGIAPAQRPASSSYAYPAPNWMGGPVVMTEHGLDPVRGILTFTSAPLEEELAIAGPMELVLQASSTRTDMNVIARLAEQLPQAESERASGRQPNARLVTKGWLRASHRALDERRSTEGAPFHQHREAQPLTPGVPVELRVALMPCAHRFRRGSRIRLEIACGDSTLTDQQFTHAFTPDMVGTDTLHHGPAYLSRLLLPVVGGQSISLADGA